MGIWLFRFICWVCVVGYSSFRVLVIVLCRLMVFRCSGMVLFLIFCRLSILLIRVSRCLLVLSMWLV